MGEGGDQAQFRWMEYTAGRGVRWCSGMDPKIGRLPWVQVSSLHCSWLSEELPRSCPPLALAPRPLGCPLLFHLR